MQRNGGNDGPMDRAEPKGDEPDASDSPSLSRIRVSLPPSVHFRPVHSSGLYPPAQSDQPEITAGGDRRRQVPVLLSTGR